MKKAMFTTLLITLVAAAGTNTPKILGIIRHVLTLLGGIAVAVGLISETEFSALVEAVITAVGAILVLWGMISSYFAPEKKITADQYERLRSL